MSSSIPAVNANSESQQNTMIDFERDRFPFSIVWTPIPFITWFFPIIGHMGIATSLGIIRDFAGPYVVSEDNMGFGRPTKYWVLDISKVEGGPKVWDNGVREASEIYKKRMHNLFCDNCHSHVATALNLMKYQNSTSWNMVKLALLMMVHGKYVNKSAFVKTWLPFLIIAILIVAICCFVY